MIDITLLGTGGTVPLPDRWLTSLLVKWEGHELLVDCGEGTQIALHQLKYSCRHIDTILLTHFHADHTAGLPGLLLSMAKADRTEPVTIVGPEGMDSLLKGVYAIARYIPFELKYAEIGKKGDAFQVDDLDIAAFPLKHSVPCYGYDFNLPRKPVFDKEKAESLNVPLSCWNKLQKGNEVEMNGVKYTPDMVMGHERKGIHFTYATDTRPVPAIAKHADKADLLIAEGMYGDPEKGEKAVLNKHMTMQEAAAIAKEADAGELWLTHYSPSVVRAEQYSEELNHIFDHTVVSKDGQHIQLHYTDEED